MKIAILDTGVDLSHPDFKEDQSASRMNRRIKPPEDFLDVGGKAHDTCGHGTHGVGLLRKVAPEADIYVARVAKDFDGILDPEVVAKVCFLSTLSSNTDPSGNRSSMQHWKMQRREEKLECRHHYNVFRIVPNFTNRPNCDTACSGQTRPRLCCGFQ